MSIATNLHAIKEILPDHVMLVAVSKTKSNEEILEAYKRSESILINFNTHHRCYHYCCLLKFLACLKSGYLVIFLTGVV